MGRAMLSKSLIHFSVDGWGCVPSPLFDWRPSYGRDKEVNGELFQKVQCTQCRIQCPGPSALDPEAGHHTHASAGDSWTLTGKSGSVSCRVTAPFSWVLACTRFCLCPPKSVSPVLCKFYNQTPLASKVKFPGVLSPFAKSPRWEICCGS